MGVISNLFPLDYALNLNYYWFYYYEELNGIQLHGRTFRFSLNAQRRCKQLLNPPETDIFRTHTHTYSPEMAAFAETFALCRAHSG